MTYDGDWRETFRPDIPSVARIYDYLLGGKDNYPADRAHVRSRAEIRKLVAGMDIIEPGLAWPPEWRPDPGEEVPANAAESYYCVVVARTLTRARTRVGPHRPPT